MAKDDTALKIWLSNKERFADLFNGTMFKGKQVVKPEDLELIKGESVAVIENKNENGKDKAVQRYRDITMRWNRMCNLMILACENQGAVNYGMPVRVMTYDGLTYTDQIREYEYEINRGRESKIDIYYSEKLKEKLLIPTFTIIFYYGEKEWDGPKEVYDMFGIMEHKSKRIIKKFVPNYKLNIVETRKIKDFSKFKSDLQIVLNMLNYRKDRVKLRNYMEKNKEYFNHINRDALAALGLLLNAKKKVDEMLKSEEEEFNMCKALDDIYNDGLEKGISQGISQGREEGIIVLIETLREIGSSDTMIKSKLEEKYNLSDDEIQRYIGKKA